jgi:hypothetical protein
MGCSGRELPGPMQRRRGLQSHRVLATRHKPVARGPIEEMVEIEKNWRS